MGRGSLGRGGVGRGRAGRGEAPHSPYAILSKKRGFAAFASVDLCVSLKRGAAAALFWSRDPEVTAAECMCPGFPGLAGQEREQAWDVHISPLIGRTGAGPNNIT